MRKLYELNKILEIVLFFISVFVVTYLSNEKMYKWLGLAVIIIIILEVFLKNTEYNFIIKTAAKRESKIKELEEKGIENHYFMSDTFSKSKRYNSIANAIREANEMHLLAESGKSYLDITTDRYWKNIKEKLDKGIHFRILLVNPFSENKKVRNRLNNISTELDRKLDLENLKKNKK